MIYDTFSLNTSLLITVSTISAHHFAPYMTFPTAGQIRAARSMNQKSIQINMEKSWY